MTIQEELQSGAPLKALSWREPYASMMLHGKIETRSWPTKYRGLVLICASKKRYSPDSLYGISNYAQRSKMAWILGKVGSFAFVYDNMFNLGHAIAIGRLIASRPMTWEDKEKAFVKYRADLWCHVYEDVTLIEPFPWKGKQGWSNVSQEIINQIKFR
jgi:hypothetical protein